MTKPITIQARLPRNSIPPGILNSLFHSFRSSGYSEAEAKKLAEIAISTVAPVLKLAHQVVKLHLEAISKLTQR